MSGEPTSQEELMILFEAARWAPSSYNNQPWRILYAHRDTEHWPLFFDLLVPANQAWAKNAGALLLFVSKKTFDFNGQASITHTGRRLAFFSFFLLIRTRERSASLGGEVHARVIASSHSKVTRRPFNLVVAFESATDDHGNKLGRGIAESSFHHFADYNWNTEMGCPTFLAEPPGDGYKRNPEALEDIKTYVSNAASWLAGA